jgi:hypothetical protein
VYLVKVGVEAKRRVQGVGHMRLVRRGVGKEVVVGHGRQDCRGCSPVTLVPALSELSCYAHRPMTYDCVVLGILGIEQR